MYIDVDDLVGRWASTVAINEVVKSNAIRTWMWVPRDGLSPDLPPKKGMAPTPRQQVPPPAVEAEAVGAASTSDEVVTSEQCAVGTAQQGGDDGALSSSGEPAIPSAFQPKKTSNLSVMPEPSPRLRKSRQ